MDWRAAVQKRGAARERASRAEKGGDLELQTAFCEEGKSLDHSGEKHLVQFSTFSPVKGVERGGRRSIPIRRRTDWLL